MNNGEEQAIRGHLRMCRALGSGLIEAAESFNGTQSNKYLGLDLLAHIDAISDTLDQLREREEAQREAWRREMESQAEELF